MPDSCRRAIIGRFTFAERLEMPEQEPTEAKRPAGHRSRMVGASQPDEAGQLIGCGVGAESPENVEDSAFSGENSKRARRDSNPQPPDRQPASADRLAVDNADTCAGDTKRLACSLAELSAEQLAAVVAALPDDARGRLASLLS